MPIDPMTGQYLPYASGTDEMPGLGMRLLENAPGITASIGFSSRRGANTMLSGVGPRAKRASDFIGSSARRNNAMATGKTPFVKRAFANNNPLNPRNMFRYSDMSVFASQGSGMYTPFAASGFLGERKFVKNMLGMSDEAGSVLGPGLLSAISAGSRVDRMERKAAARRAQGKNVGRRLERRLAKSDKALGALGRVTGAAPGMSSIPSVNAGIKLGAGVSAGPSSFVGGAAGGRAGAYASLLAGKGTQKAAGFVLGAAGRNMSYATGFAKEGAENAVKMFGQALGGRQRVAAKAIEQGVLKTVGVRGTAQALMTKQGAQVLGARALGLALPGLQVVAAASFMYDVGKMAGTAVKGSIDLAKDSIKSMQGSLYKPMFGMGYNDTEAAATSRARGVMAIQNSRLNARSMLGSEAGMMAAHFG